MNRHPLDIACVLLPLAAVLVFESSCAFGDGPTWSAEPWDGPSEFSGSVAEVAYLRLDGQVSEAGAELLAWITADGTYLVADVRDNELVARDLANPDRVLSGDELRGGAFWVRVHREHAGPADWLIRVRQISEVERLSDERGRETVYRLTRAPAWAPDREHYLCTGRPEAVLLFGEKYEPGSLRIAATNQGAPWMSIACLGDVLATMKLASYDPGRGPHDPYATTRAQRQATIHMLRADYCGDGTRWHRAELAIGAENASGWAVFSTADALPGAAPRLEAGWDERGVTCLDTPRGADLYERADIEAACGRELPTCTDEILARSEWTTWAR